MKLLVIIPAYNESANIVRVVENLKQTCPQYNFLVINDCSKDNTAEICRENGYPYLDLPINLGLSGGFQTGMRYAFQNGYDYAIQFDGDGQHRAEFIQPMQEAMEKDDLDIVIGSRFVTEKKAITARMIGSRFIEAAIRLTTGHHIADPTSGMRMYNKKMIREFALNLNYAPEPDTIAYLAKNGAKVKEVQVKMDERIAGESYLNISRSIRYMMTMSISIIFIQMFRKRGA